ncbi:protein RRP6-like 3 [Phalaenopsis equestris]|uniref:protein RRP6-like 3 n=1 Tax=Phalaenopsis equestris TaxID=78828 RepID=UPI0009E5FB5D|nr:protein RRP6-like 3 [Phalaenopsis equestris]
MARRDRVKAAMAIACVFVAATFLFVAQIYRRRRQREGGACRRRCSEVEDKPQNFFKCVGAENSYTPFKHFKREGKEKEISLKMHPYEEEINFLLEHPPLLVKLFTNHLNSDMGNSYLWIRTKHQLESLAETLSKEKVFAVDTEQHSLRSFLGFTALMQISTQKEDFLVDTIALHDDMGILRPVFADPSICKVFHGADSDVLWLQRDFHIYVVNMFDTSKACEVLSKPQKSLAFLLETYCDVLTDKSLQREDWRQRPLSAEMIQYARTDAHYLLRIADCLAAELRRGLDKSACPDDKFNFFLEASRRSNTVCLQLYAKEIESSPGASAAASILSRNWNKDGVSTCRTAQTKDLIWKVCAWRDLVARIHDESLRYVLSDYAIVNLSMNVPTSPEKIFEIIEEADFSYNSQSSYPSFLSPSPVVRTHIDELWLLLQYPDSDISDVLMRHQQKHLDTLGCCPLSIYNYSLLSEITLKQNVTPFSWQSGGKSTATAGRKSSREHFVQKFSCKSPVYHNCRIYANDGRLLCYCDRRKLDWYLQRDLAKIVEEEPPAIMLLFEPKGRPEDEGNEFYIQSKKNICVGCGEKNHYLRYRIIPSCYRMHFPEHLKSHRSHDIVLLCVDCHENAHAAAEKHKKKVAEEFGIPLFVEKIADSEESNAVMVKQLSERGGEEKGVPPLQLRTAAMALLRNGSHMPSKRKDELMQIVKAYFGGREVLPEDLETALLVGMSPNERKRVEKKRGLSLRHVKACVSKGNDSSPLLGTPSNSQLENIKCSLEERLEDKGNMEINLELKCISNHVIEGIPAVDEQNSNESSRQIEERKGLGRDVCASSESNGNGIPEQQRAESAQSCKSDPGYSSIRANKLSLLGHGHHGKEVVKRLLVEHGEDGILQFCQKWRQVFVEGVNPRFLPRGWDIMHSGRRDFGDFSAYNPAKKNAAA